jgi:hypothetical protein
MRTILRFALSAFCMAEELPILGLAHVGFQVSDLEKWTDQRTQFTSGDGQERLLEGKRGDLAWSTGRARHTEKNLLETLWEVVVVEPK